MLKGTLENLKTSETLITDNSKSDWKADILKSIELRGAINDNEVKVNPIIGGNLNHIAGITSGRMKIYSTMIKKFKLIIEQPTILSAMNPFEIRCALCKKVISYPCWYYSIKYTVNHFHYFVCFNDPKTVNASCYRR